MGRLKLRNTIVPDLEPNVPTQIRIDREKVAALCRRWKIAELAFFGSVLGKRFSPESDVDVLVTLAPQVAWGLLDWLAMEEELGTVLGRKVDLVNRRSIERSHNPIRRREILNGARTYYAT